MWSSSGLFLENLYFRRVSRSFCELFDPFCQGYVQSVNPHCSLTENTYQFDVYLKGNDKKCQTKKENNHFFLSKITVAFVKTYGTYLTQRFSSQSLKNTQYLSRIPRSHWLICNLTRVTALTLTASKFQILLNLFRALGSWNFYFFVMIFLTSDQAAFFLSLLRWSWNSLAPDQLIYSAIGGEKQLRKETKSQQRVKKNQIQWFSSQITWLSNH